jgi:hypothetical protein
MDDISTGMKGACTASTCGKCDGPVYAPITEKPEAFDLKLDGGVLKTWNSGDACIG